MPRLRANAVAPNVTALGVQVDSLEGDVRELKDSIVGLDAKIDNAVTRLAHEFRTATSALSTQLNDRQRTPWIAVFSGCGVLITFLGIVGTQALSPTRDRVNEISQDVKQVKDTMVPRSDIDRMRGEIDGIGQTYIQQQRYNTDQTRMGAVIDDIHQNYMRARDFEVQHKDLESLIESQRTNVDKREDGIVRRLERLEAMGLRSEK